MSDFLIVGAGSAGATLASRLTEDERVTVTLLEAGPDYRSAGAPPEMFSPNPGHIINDTRFLYTNLVGRRTAKQDAKVYWRGKGMGGSSAINGQIAIRAAPEDFERWPAGWQWDDVLPYFNKLEDDLDFGDRPYHGSGGPIPVYRAPVERWGAVDRALREATLALGYGWHDDHNAPDSTGCSPYAINSRDGRRVSTNDAYLEPARDRPNLTIIGDALVDRVELVGGRATGVRARVDGEWRTYTADTVLLCAGAIHSPAILIRSGIGPARDVAELGIGVIHDIAVGVRLLDHPVISLVLQLKDETRAGVHDRHTNCCVRYNSEVADGGRNDMIFIGMNGLAPLAPGFGMIGVSVFESFSHGTLRLRSADPETDPELDFEMLTDARDLERMHDGVRRLFEIGRHPALTSICDNISAGLTGPPDSIRTPGEVEDWLLRECGDTQHGSGTCAMGAIVDEQCRVLGLDGLRVIDASIFPEVPRANTHLTTVMAAEKMADELTA